MNSIIKDCIQQLERIKSLAENVTENDMSAQGINLVNECVKSGIQDRIQYLMSEADEGATNQYAVFCCLEQVDSFIRVLNEFAEGYGDDDFGKGVKKAVSSFVDKLKFVRTSLKMLEMDIKYNN